LQIGLAVSTSFEVRSWKLNTAKDEPKRDYVEDLKCCTVLRGFHSYREKNTFASEKDENVRDC
jgi:hypothetical protein